MQWGCQWDKLKQDLYHPVLPYRTEGKLIFPLCSSCVESQFPNSLHKRSHYCHRSNTKRALTGTWCTPELEALNQSYKLLKVNEIWHFPHSSTTLFTEYINTFLKIKQEADSTISNKQLIIVFASSLIFT